MKRIVINISLIIVIMLALFAGVTHTAQASSGREDAHSPYLPPNARPQGTSIAEWGVKLFQTLYATPALENPITGLTNNQCAVKMDGHVGMLLTNPGAVDPYHCSIPAGTTVVTPFAGIFGDTLSWPFPTNKAGLLDFLNTYYNVVIYHVVVDGIELKNPDQYLVTTPVFSIKLPAGNIYGLPAGTTGKAMARIHILMLAPLSPGEHTIHAESVYPDLGITENFTIQLTVNNDHSSHN
jgi:hypothetical protein